MNHVRITLALLAALVLTVGIASAAPAALAGGNEELGCNQAEAYLVRGGALPQTLTEIRTFPSSWVPTLLHHTPKWQRGRMFTDHLSEVLAADNERPFLNERQRGVVEGSLIRLENEGLENIGAGDVENIQTEYRQAFSGSIREWMLSQAIFEPMGLSAHPSFSIDLPWKQTNDWESFLEGVLGSGVLKEDQQGLLLQLRRTVADYGPERMNEAGGLMEVAARARLTEAMAKSFNPILGAAIFLGRGGTWEMEVDWPWSGSEETVNSSFQFTDFCEAIGQVKPVFKDGYDISPLFATIKSCNCNGCASCFFCILDCGGECKKTTDGCGAFGGSSCEGGRCGLKDPN